MSRKGEPHSIRPVPRSRTRSQKALSQEGSSPGEATFSAQSEPESSLAPDDEEEEEEEEEYSNGSDNLLQTYLDDRYSHRRRNYYIRLLVARFVYSDQFDATKAEQAQQTIIKLAEHEKVFQKLLSYTVEDVKRDFLKVTYSTIRLWQMVEFMGVVVKSSIPASELAKALEETALLPKFQLLSRDEIDVDDFADDFDAEKEIQEMPSTVEAQARFRISTILKKIIHLFRQDEIIGVGEELLLGHWKSKTGPIEIRHRTGDGIVRSAFVSGRVDYVCAKGPSIRALNLPMWSIADALSRIRNETFQVTHEAHFADFLAGLEQNFSEALVKYDSVSDDLSWDACVLEAKNMNKRFSFKSIPSGAGYVHETSDERTDESLGKSSRPSGRRDIVNDIRADHQSTQPQESGLYNAFLGRSPRRLVNARIHGSEILSPLGMLVSHSVFHLLTLL
ncbi:hypothetical protein NP233_g10340 [Leucocoprinus birnbaumii]|uniref:Uncharacterized protein n=1 Tax=Leucocoprinus birnbaumii TaxID=56174 RepID=A0AAD5VM73_9AGAR|nr:hypothetical protein NP233_g10340 [Leucocoprinus birnbaumii]